MPWCRRGAVGLAYYPLRRPVMRILYCTALPLALCLSPVVASAVELQPGVWEVSAHNMQVGGQAMPGMDQILAQLRGVDALRSGRADGDAEVEDARAAHEAHEVLGVVETRALREERQARFMEVAEQVSIERLQRRVGATMQVLVDHAPALGKKGGRGRSYADAPEIDGVVHLLPPEKISKTMKTGEFTRARIVGTQGHDLVGVPI